MTSSPPTWRISPSLSWSLHRPHLLAILNLTPDSFSDGGTIAGPDDAARAAEAALAAGADGLDVGGESTRPGAERVDGAEQIRRTVPAIEAVRRAVGRSPVITIDTTLAPVARAALDAGADAINDVSAGTDDPDLLLLAAERGCGVVLMHRLARPARDVYSHQYAAAPDYSSRGGVVGSVRAFLRSRLEAAAGAGIAPECVLLDPGLGFGKTVEQNLQLIAGTPELLCLGRPILSGASRKSFTAKAAGLDTALPPPQRVNATVGLSVAHLARGARVFRVHDVAAHVAALRAAWAAMSMDSNGR